MKQNTVREAIVTVLTKANSALSGQEIYDQINNLGLYKFKSKNPRSIVAAELRKSCLGIDVRKGASIKLFEMRENGKYALSTNNANN